MNRRVGSNTNEDGNGGRGESARHLVARGGRDGGRPRRFFTQQSIISPPPTASTPGSDPALWILRPPGSMDGVGTSPTLAVTGRNSTSLPGTSSCASCSNHHRLRFTRVGNPLASPSRHCCCLLTCTFPFPRFQSEPTPPAELNPLATTRDSANPPRTSPSLHQTRLFCLPPVQQQATANQGYFRAYNLHNLP